MEKPTQGRVAFCTVPHVGGIFSVYRRLRKALAPRGWQVFGVQVGDELHRWSYAPEIQDEGCIKVAEHERDGRTAAREFVRWVEDHQIDIVLPMSSPFALAAVPHLPISTRVVTRCIDITPLAYKLATIHPERVTKVVTISKRQRDDLSRRYHVPAGKIAMIPNAVNCDEYVPKDLSRQDQAPLRLVFLGRLCQRQKSVLLLPKIAAMLKRINVPFQLTIIGSGPDEGLLRSSFANDADQESVQLLGDQSPTTVSALLPDMDVLLMTSKHEGCPSALIEAMACGVVPVVSRIKGVTDWIVESGRTGLLCPINDANAFAQGVERLHHDRGLLAALSQAARKEVESRFNLNEFADSYARVFSLALSSPPYGGQPRPWSEYQASSVFQRSKLWWIPRRYKDAIRTCLERVRSN